MNCRGDRRRFNDRDDCHQKTNSRQKNRPQRNLNTIKKKNKFY